MNFKKLTNLALFLIFAYSIDSYAVSFSCSGELTKIEKIICKNESIGKLDDEMSLLYKNASEKTQPNIYVVLSQRQWLSRVRNVCKNEVCIEKAYQARNAELSNWANSKNSLFISILGKWRGGNIPTEGAVEYLYEDRMVSAIEKNISNHFKVIEITDQYILIKPTDALGWPWAFIKYSISITSYNFDSKGQYKSSLYVNAYKTEEDYKKNEYSTAESIVR
jgi:uncharacterized protein